MFLCSAVLIATASIQAADPGARFDAIRPAAEKAQKITSIAIVQNGKPVFETYLGEGINASTRHDTRSATKTIAGALIGAAIRDGKLRLDSKVLDLLPQHRAKLQNPDPRKAQITVEDLLTMSSALECDDWNDASRGNEERMYLVEDWGQFILDLPIRGRMRLGEAPATPPQPYGRYFSYCTGGVFLLSEIVQAATGIRADRYARQKLFDPLGIGQVEWMYSPLDVPQTGGGLRMTSLDLAKFAQLYLDGGGNGRVLAPEWVKGSVAAHARIDDSTEYGRLWWLRTWKSAKSGKGYASFYMTGNGGNKVVAIPALNAVVVITSTNYNSRGMHEQTDKLLTDVILPALE